MKTVAIGFLGTNLDAGGGADRWGRWRPTVSLCQHEDLLIDRLEVFYDAQSQKLLRRVQQDIAQISPETEFVSHEMNLKDPWDFEEVYGQLFNFTSTYQFDVEKEDYLIHITTGTHVVQICMFLLTEARFFPGRLLQTSPAARSRGAAPGRYSTIDLDLSKYDRIATRFQQERREATSFLKSGIVTQNQAFNQMIDDIEHVAIRSDAPILLMGPTGAGKSQLARRIFELKTDRHQIAGPFVEVNCATLRGDSAMSTLFGHKKGAFTGAVSDRLGLLKTADKGMLFLDEIGELGLDEQAMILRAIEERLFLPVGSDKEIKSDFQLIAGTNKDLGAEVAGGKFREDLLARLNLWTFHMPGLKDRREDIPPNVEYEMELHAKSRGEKISFNKEALRHFLKFAQSPEAIWTANFRDLSASITRMATFAPSGRINEANVRDEIERLRQTWRATNPSDTDLLCVMSEKEIAEIDPFDRPQLSLVLEVCKSSRSLSEAGRKLFAMSRLHKKSSNDADRLRKYLDKYGLTWQQIV